MKKISYFLIILGILLIAFPQLNKIYNNYQKDKIMKDWQKSMNTISVTDKKEQTSNNTRKSTNQISDNSSNEIKDTKEIVKKQEKKDNMKNILKIDKIDLKLPVLNGATEKNLDISVAKMNHTSNPGEAGNYAIAGHRSYTYGKQFNRLNEIEKGDEIEVITSEGLMKYKVTKKFLVDPEDVWVLDGNNKDKIITLITCHPIRIASHRLIIRGELVE